MLGGPLSSNPVDVSSIIGHAILRVVGDIVLVELALPVQQIVQEISRIAKDLLLGILRCKAA